MVSSRVGGRAGVAISWRTFVDMDPDSIADKTPYDLIGGEAALRRVVIASTT
jgi:hypothetical protein